ncbi:MAG TPA: hypothetical protein VIL01_06185 [Thermomicrobiales bacterium]
MQTTWEYRMVGAVSEEELNALGAEGWELVAVSGYGVDPTLYLKRPVLDFRERVTLDQKRRYYASWGLATGDSGEGDRS